MIAMHILYVYTYILYIDPYVHVSKAIFVYVAQPGNSSLQVTITSDPPDNTLCVNETVSLTCQVSNAAQPTYKWSSTKFNISDHSNSIKVIATDVPVQYYCNVFDASTNESGEAGITIYGKGIYPQLF